MFRKFLFWFLISLGLINTLIVIVSSIVGPNAYVLAESISKYFNIILGYVPFFLVCTSLFLINLIKLIPRLIILLLLFLEFFQMLFLQLEQFFLCKNKLPNLHRSHTQRSRHKLIIKKL